MPSSTHASDYVADTMALILKKNPNCREFPMNFAVVETTAQITDIRELHDRLIAGTARLLNLELITNDPIIQASSFLKTLW